MIPQREETGSRMQWKSTKKQRTGKDTKIRRKKGMQRKKRKTKKEGDTTGLKARGDTKLEKTTLKRTKGTKGRSTETESNTQMDTKKARMTEKDERGVQKGGRTEVRLFLLSSLVLLFLCGQTSLCFTSGHKEEHRRQREEKERRHNSRDHGVSAPSADALTSGLSVTEF